MFQGSLLQAEVIKETKSIERGNLQKAELSATVDGALDMLPLLQSCRFVDAAPGFGSEL